MRPPTPQKLQAVLLQLAPEPLPHRLNLNASYSSISALASAVGVVSHLDLNNLSPVYTCRSRTFTTPRRRRSAATQLRY